MPVMKTLLGAVKLRNDDHGAAVTLSGTTLSGLPMPALVLSADGRILSANAAANTIADALACQHLPALAAPLARTLASGLARSEIVTLPGPGGPALYELSLIPAVQGAVLVLARDVTLENNLRATLVESRQRYKDLVEISTDFAWETGPDGRFVFVSPRGALGHGADQLVGHAPGEFIADQAGMDGLLPFRPDQPIEDAEVWMRRADGRIACVRVSSSPLLDAQGRPRGARGICRDVTSERERDAALARANNRERLLAYILRTIRDVVDPADILSIATEAITRALGGVGCQVFRHGGDGFSLAGSFGRTGEATPVLAAATAAEIFDSPVGDHRAGAVVTRHHGSVNGLLVIWRDGRSPPWGEDERLLLADLGNQIGIANEQIVNHERILTLSRTDGLTGLFNRRAFFEELSRRFSRLSREHKPAALIYVDLDNFKLVNDVHGHRRGDEALLAVRDILVQHSRPTDLIARLGGDEFALWLEGADEPTAVRRCEAMIAAAQVLGEFSGAARSPLTMSLGVAVHSLDHDETLNDMLLRADEAMYAVKRDGKRDYRLAPPLCAVPLEVSGR